MDLDALLTFVALIALFATMSILTVASITFSKQAADRAFLDSSTELAARDDADAVYRLREAIFNFSGKVFKLYVIVAVLIVIPVIALPSSVSFERQFPEAYEMFVSLKPSVVIANNYSYFALAVFWSYSVYIVRQITRFKSGLLEIE